ncbi:MAG TPA: hypothetical protein VGC73_08835 [Pyrinomonadaceae bacterium]
MCNTVTWASWMVCVFRLMRPGIDAMRLRMIVQVKYFYLAFPNSLTVEYFLDRHCLNVC